MTAYDFALQLPGGPDDVDHFDWPDRVAVVRSRHADMGAAWAAAVSEYEIDEIGHARRATGALYLLPFDLTFDEWPSGDWRRQNGRMRFTGIRVYRRCDSHSSDGTRCEAHEGHDRCHEARRGNLLWL